jgi:1,2-diacylglycerol 3-beta-galactosyltransferase
MLPSRYLNQTPLANIVLLSCFVGISLSFTASSGQGRRDGAVAGFSFKTLLPSTSDDDDICTIQILMSDTGGGHRASANALRDALDVLYPGKIHCDIVDIYTEYGPIWPYNDYVNGYKLMAKNPWMWDAFYRFGCTDFGICVNEVMLENICFDAFSECLSRPSGGTERRADMVVSVHPLLQELPLKILAKLDSGTRQMSARTTPFCTVVTDLGSAHPTWFHPG